MNARGAITALVALAVLAPATAALENEPARREHLKQLRAAVRAFGLLYPGKTPEKVSQLLDENLVDGPAALVRPGAKSVPPRGELEARTDYSLAPLPGVADMVVREKAPLPGESEVLAALADGTIKAVAVGPTPAVATAASPPPPAGAVDGPPAPREEGPRAPSPPANPTTPPATTAATTAATTRQLPDAPPPIAQPPSSPIGLPPSPPIPNDPERFARWLQAGQAAFAQQDAPRAREAFAEAVKENANSVEALIGLARSQNAIGELEAAIASYQSVQRLAPATPNLATWLAEVHLALGDLASARRLLEAELRAQPGSAWAWSWLGTLELEAANRLAAQQHFARAVQLDGNVIEFRYQNCGWLARHQQHARAAREAASVIAMNPNHAGAHYAAGDSYARLGRREPALHYFHRYLQFDATSQWAAQARQQIAQLHAGAEQRRN